MIRSAGARLWYLPPYSPDLNPIEQAFSHDRVRARLARGLRGKAKRQVMRGRGLLHARVDKLSLRARATLASWLSNDPELADTWEAKEAFYAIWDGHLRTDGQRLFNEWHNDLTTRLRSVIEDFDALLDGSELEAGDIRFLPDALHKRIYAGRERLGQDRQ